MVLVVFAHAFQRMQDLDPEPLEFFHRAEAGEHENLRRVVDARAEHNLVAGRALDRAVSFVAHLSDFASTDR